MLLKKKGEQGMEIQNGGEGSYVTLSRVVWVILLKTDIELKQLRSLKAIWRGTFPKGNPTDSSFCSFKEQLGGLGAEKGAWREQQAGE